jgi:aminoglycoside phosphotransferase (APT) family kinase protein
VVENVALARATDLIAQDVLLHVPGFASGRTTARASKLYGGTVNTSYRVETSAGRFVVRLHNPEARLLGADHEREAQLHAAAAASGLAPSLVHVDSDHRFMIMEYVAGELWTLQDFSRAERLQQLGGALHILHTIVPPVVAPFDVGAVLELHYQRLREVPEEAAGFAALMRRAADAMQASGTQGRAKAFVHNDVHHSNLIGSERLYLLDWEYAAVADPLFDLACILAYYPQAAEHAEALLDATRLAAVANAAMLREATWLWMLVSYFWYRARRLSGPATSAEMAVEESLLQRLG